MLGHPVISAPGIPTDVSRPFPARDLILSGVPNDGVRFMFDLAFPYSYPGGPLAARPAAGPPNNGATIQDMMDRANGSVIVPGGAIAYAGGGFDMTNVLPTTSLGVQVPASALLDVATAFGGKAQRYLLIAWVKLPTLANWNSAGALLSIIGDKAFSSGPSLLTINQQTGGVLSTRRQLTASTSDNTSLTPDADDYGSVVQLAMWRSDAGQGFRLRSAKGTKLVTSAIGADNTQDFSAGPFVFGHPNAFNGAINAGTVTLPAFSGFRVYRGALENLARSGRNPVTVLDADYAAVTARAPFT